MIVAFHRPEALARLVGELQRRELEIIVVNVEADPEVARAADGCTVLPLDHNVGYAAAVNVGVRHTTGSVIVFMNDDLTVTSENVLRLVVAVEQGADVAVPRVQDPEGRTVRTVAALPTPSSLAREWLLLPDQPVDGLRRLGVEKWREPMAPERIGAASAVLVATRREVLVDRPLPEDYFLYWEESEWFWHLERDDARVELHPDAVCVHDGGRDDVRGPTSRGCWHATRSAASVGPRVGVRLRSRTSW